MLLIDGRRGMVLTVVLMVVVGHVRVEMLLLLAVACECVQVVGGEHWGVQDATTSTTATTPDAIAVVVHGCRTNGRLGRGGPHQACLVECL